MNQDNKNAKIGKVAIGKRQEYRAVAELLGLGYDVYMPVVDDKQIDCILRIDDNRYLDIQIKARSKQIEIKKGGVFTGKSFEPRDTYFFIFYSEHLDTYWIMPSRKLKEYVHQLPKMVFLRFSLLVKLEVKMKFALKRNIQSMKTNLNF